MPKLPIEEKAKQILEAAARGRRLALCAPPGSGKSTKVPQLLLDAGLCKGRIAVLEPRRLAARMLAERVAAERGGVAGGEVGYRVRFDDKTSRDTRIIFETEGILLRELVSDPRLEKYSAVILDEFHERHIYGDLALAVCLELQKSARPDLLVIVMSATLDVKALSAYMAPCQTLQASGTVHPVRITYCGPDLAKLPPWEASAKTCARVLPAMNGGHALIFMPGAFEINRTAAALAGMPGLSDFAVMPLHGEMSPRDQAAALAPSGRRKIIIATNIAETSLTIDGVAAVIDSGLARVARFDGARAINTLFTEKISAASAEQRAGRAGRTMPGICARLWPEREDSHRPLTLEPEMLRLDISEVLLTLKACGYSGFEALKWLDMPEAKSLSRAENTLRLLGAIDKSGALTKEGRAMARYPLHPRYSRMMVEAERLGCVYECAIIAAAAQGRGLWVDGAKLDALYGDEARSDLYAAVKGIEICAASNFDQTVCAGAGVKPQAAREAWNLAKRLAGGAAPGGREAFELVPKCFLRAFPDRVAALVSKQSGRYELPGGKRAHLKTGSAASGAELLCAGEALESMHKAGADIALSFAAEIKEEWLRSSFPGDIKDVARPALDKDMLTPVTEKITLYGDLKIKSVITSAARGRSSADLIAEEFISGRHKFSAWNEEVEEWLLRVEFLARVCPDLGFSPLDGEDLKLVMADICSGARSVSEAKSRPVLPALQNWFGWEKNRLIDKYAPLKLEMPGGRRARIHYPRGGEPYLEARIQDLFSLADTPRIAAGRVMLVVHVLAPSMRPVQVTKDLKSFWKESYPKLRPQLARRYPKHKWP